uniref:Formate dehydrogenase -O, gamma subunit (EC) n=1 Tax=uncultured Thiotrichaceae bacterium TaxID=298394 RepID=A0A6S6UA01_9GAMM|nr:MAG: Formate dehydrogenase -O, gamma subunit (EC [uncultured Thiotrichaceae bacterium]
MQKLLVGLLLILFLPFSVVATAAAPTSNGEMQQLQDPGANIWNAARGREEADTGQIRTQVKGVDSNVLINRGGDEWRLYRMEELIPMAAKVLGAVAIAILVFRLIRGKIPIKSGRSSNKIKRFSTFQRWVHWITAILFVGLSITGIALMFGRHIVMPLFGPEAGGTVMVLMKRIHDISGPMFAIALIVLTLTFIKGNFAHISDLKWVFKGGGLFGGHAPAGRYNAGEKGWYWIAVILGGAVVVSGLILNFPNFELTREMGFALFNLEQSRETMSFYHWVHSIATVVIMAAAMGHIYMGTIAMEGAFEAMQTGYCDENWAKEHHDLWHEEMVEKGHIIVGNEQESDHSAVTQQDRPA